MTRARTVENRAKALAYLRTSSAQNVGGDSDQRQREAITRFAHAQGYELAGEFYCSGV
jgi:DNA invertase Pin-like site-specific DNA recombinase